MSVSRNADWAQANVRIRRLCPEAFVTYARERGYSHRWLAWERMTIPLTLDEDLLSQPGMTKETECVVASAPTAVELLHKFTLIKSAQRAGRLDMRLLFRDRVLRGEEQMPPPDPPEWAEYKAKMRETVEHSKERTTNQIQATVRNFLALQGLELGAKERRALGIGRGEFWTKGKG